MITLKERNIKKSRDARKKGGLPKIVTGICPLCKINLYGKKRCPKFIVDKEKSRLVSYCEVKTCPF